MKSRLRKKEEKRRRKKIHEALDIVLDINSLQERRKEITGESSTAFFEFSGHVGKVDVRIHTNGWYDYASANVDIAAYTYRTESLDMFLNNLKEAAHGIKQRNDKK